MTDADQPEPARENECVRCRAGATVGLIILEMSHWMGRMHRGDGRPPAALMAALYAEDWEAVKRQWDAWVWPQLQDEHEQATAWRSTADSMIRVTGEVLQSHGGSGPPPDLIAARAVGEARAVAAEWIRWILRAVDDVAAKRASEEWEAYAATLPAELRELAAEHPVKQAEVIATEFEVMAMHQYLLSAPPAEEPEEDHDGPDGVESS